MTTKPPKMKMTIDIPASVTAPDQVETSLGTLKYFDGVPTEATVDTVYDYLDRSRAVEAFMNCIPVMSMYSIKEGQRAFGVDAPNKVIIYDTLLDSKSLWLTANTSTMYAMGWLDLKRWSHGYRSAAANVGHSRRCGLPLYDGSGHGRSRQGQGRQVPGAASRL